MEPRHNGWSNCLVYALGKFFREGGYLIIRPSRYFKLIPHFLHMSESGIISHWQPIKPINGWKAVFAKVWFKGAVKRNDLRISPEGEAEHAKTSG